jgi:hypothetical protein
VCVAAVSHGELNLSEDPSVRRIHSKNCIVGDYLVIAESRQQGSAPDYVTAEISAHDYARKNPGTHVMIAQVSAQVIGVPHIYEVQGK